MNVIYKKASVDDAYDIRYISAHSWKETYSNLVPSYFLDYKLEHIEDKVDEQKQFITDGKNDYYIAEADGKNVGFVCFGECDSDDYKGYGYVLALYLLKDYQGFGIGKNLFKIALEGLKEKGFTKLILECMSGNKTISFYEKYNGKIVDTINYPLIEGKLSVKAEVITFDIDKALQVLNNK